MDSRALTSYTRRGAAVRVLSLLLAVAAAGLAEARGPEGDRTGLANYTFETHYELRPGGSVAFDRFWAALQDSSPIGTAIARYVDAVDEAGHTRRVVTLPVERLAEYGADRRNEEILRAALGEDAAGAIIGDFNDAQLSRTSYLRQYRTDLSVNRDRHHRGTATTVSLVTVMEGQEPAFERVWRRAADAYRTIAPGQAVTVARTLVGGGPQFVIARPLQPQRSAGLEPVEAVRQAYGDRAALEFEEDLRAMVATWRTATYTNLGLDTAAVPQETRR